MNLIYFKKKLKKNLEEMIHECKKYLLWQPEDENPTNCFMHRLQTLPVTPGLHRHCPVVSLLQNVPVTVPTELQLQTGNQTNLNKKRRHQERNG